MRAVAAKHAMEAPEQKRLKRHANELQNKDLEKWKCIELHSEIFQKKQRDDDIVVACVCNEDI